MLLGVFWVADLLKITWAGSRVEKPKNRNQIKLEAEVFKCWLKADYWHFASWI